MTARLYLAMVIALSTSLIFSSTRILGAETPTVRDTPAPKTMLFVGDSFIYYNQSLQKHTRKLVQSIYPQDAKRFFFKSITVSEGYLSDHLISAHGMIKGYRRKKMRRPWEVVVLQGEGGEPIDEKISGQFQASARQLDKWIREAGSKTVLLMTWAYKDKPEMAQPLADAYTRMGNELNALVVPVGLAFDMARSENPEMELYDRDAQHPSLLGSYLAANVFFATLYGRSPVGAPYRAELSEREAAFAQHIAWKTVQTYFGRENY